MDRPPVESVTLPSAPGLSSLIPNSWISPSTLASTERAGRCPPRRIASKALAAVAICKVAFTGTGPPVSE